MNSIGQGFTAKAKGLGIMLKKDFIKNKYLYIMVFPLVLYYVIFHYCPMYGVQIAFKKFNIAEGITKSPWIGFDHFIRFFKSHYFARVTFNTFIMNVYLVLFGFPAPIILALLFNELRQQRFKKLVQTISYLPHFISVVVICAIIVQFTALDGIVNDILVFLGYKRSVLLLRPELFRTIFVSTSIWQEVGWSSIVYLAALSEIDQEQYESATIDGAGKWKQLLHVTLPGILPTIVIMLILRMGQMMSLGFEKVLLLYNPATYSTSDVISTYVYRAGLVNFNYDYSAAVGLFNSLINLIFLISSNYISKKVNETSLW